MRQYARRRRGRGLPGGTSRAVEKAVASGRLAGAVHPDGTLDFSLADRLWKENTTRRPSGHAIGNGNGAVGGPKAQTLAAVQAQLVALRVERERWLLEKERGLWLRATDVRRAQRARAQRTRDALLILPHRLAHTLHMVDAMVVEQALDRALRAALEAECGPAESGTP